MSTACLECGGANRAGARFCRDCGQPLPGAAASPAHAPPEAGATPAGVPPEAGATPAGAATAATPEIARLRAERRRLHRRLAILGAVVLLVLCGYGTLSVAQDKLYAPDDPVKALFAALAGHDLDKAGTLAGCSGAPLCRAAVLAQGYTAPIDLAVTGVSYSGRTDRDTRRPDKNRAWVGVRYRLGDRSVTGSIQVTRTGSGWFRRWRIHSGGYGHVDVVSKVVAQARVAQARVATIRAARDSRSWSLGTTGPQPALPGVYTVTMAADDPLFDASPVTVPVTGDADEQEPAVAELTAAYLTVKPAVLDEITRQVRVRIDECATKTDLYPTGCPFQAPGVVAIATNVHWTIVDYPQLKVRPDEDLSGRGTAAVSTVTKGHARATYVRLQSNESLMAEINVRGSATVDASGKVVFDA